MQPFDQVLQIIAAVMRAGVAKHPDDEWMRRPIEYHLGWAEDYLRLLHDGDQ